MFDFELYMDDSGTHDGSQTAVAACYIASRGHWKAFVKAWNKVLKREHLEAEGFHMTDFMARPERGVKPYCDWSQSKRDRVYAELASIINTHIKHGFAFAVPAEAFFEHASEHFRKENASVPFTLAVETVLGLLKEWCSNQSGKVAIQFVFENRKGKGEIMQIMEVLREDPSLADSVGFRPDYPDGVSFQSPKLFKPLQAADILAWTMRNHMESVVAKCLPDELPHLHPYFDQLRTDQPVRLGYLSDQQVKEAFDKMRTREAKTGERAYLLPRKKLRRAGPLPK